VFVVEDRERKAESMRGSSSKSIGWSKLMMDPQPWEKYTTKTNSERTKQWFIPLLPSAPPCELSGPPHSNRIQLERIAAIDSITRGDPDFVLSADGGVVPECHQYRIENIHCVRFIECNAVVREPVGGNVCCNATNYRLYLHVQSLFLHLMPGTSEWGYCDATLFSIFSSICPFGRTHCLDTITMCILKAVVYFRAQQYN
jgi:hypothetical protein